MEPDAPPSLPSISRRGFPGSIHRPWWSPCGAGRSSKVLPPSTERKRPVFSAYTRALRIREDVAEVPGALPVPLVLVDALPAGAGVVGAVQAAVLGLDEGPDALAVGRRHADADAAEQ